MVEIRKLKKEDMDELFALLNHTFGHKYGRPMHFDREQPKMWIRDDLHMERHIAAFEDGKMVSACGIYPLPAVIGGEEFLFCTTGNVATHPEYEGKGYFSRLFPMAMEEAARIGAVAARLGGARQRYGRYGFEPCGPAYEFRITEHNAKYAGDALKEISLSEIAREDAETLAYCHALMQKKTFFVQRGKEEGYRDTYLALCSKEARPYLIKRNETPIGYLAAKGNFEQILEFSLENEADIFLAAATAAKMSPSNMTSLCVPQTMPIAISVLQAQAQEISVVHPSRFNILQFSRLANRLLKLKESLSPLPACDLVLQIEGGERLHLHTGADGAFCRETEEKADLSLSHIEGERFLFGIYREDLLSELEVEKQWALRNILPLPLTWCTNDFT